MLFLVKKVAEVGRTVIVASNWNKYLVLLQCVWTGALVPQTLKTITYKPTMAKKIVKHV